MTCLCKTPKCRGRGVRTVAGDLLCPTTEAIESAAVAAVQEAGASAGATVGAIRADGPTLLRVLKEHGLEVRPIRKPRQVES